MSDRFVCVICGGNGELEVTFPDGWSAIVCGKDAPARSSDVSFVDVWKAWREAREIYSEVVFGE